MAVMGDKGIVALGQIWAQVLQVCSVHFCVHMLFIIRVFKIRHKTPWCGFMNYECIL